MKNKLFFVDNLRIFLISLVVLHHLSITYGAAGGWYYTEGQPQDLARLLFAMFTATNQSFFMAMFFMISAYFIPPSLKRKGLRKFLKDRLIRLGVPTVFFYFLLNPLTTYLPRRFKYGYDASFFQHILDKKPFGFGPMWFVEALLYFTILFLIYNRFADNTEKSGKKMPFPGMSAILLFISALGCLTFMVRIWLPVGRVFHPLNLQFPHFIQYTGLFIIGIVSWQNDWMNQVSYGLGKRCFWSEQALIWIGFPLLFGIGGAASGNIDVFLGGFHWQSFGYALWEQATGIAMIIGLIGIFKEKLNMQNRLAAALSETAYAVYVFHAPLLVFLTLALRGLAVYPLLKFAAVAPIALIVIFAVSFFIRKLPVANKIL